MLNEMNRTATRRLALTLVLVVPMLSIGCSDDDDPAAPSVPPTLEAKLTDMLEDAVGPNTPGVSLRVLGNGIDLTLSAGVASLDTQEPLTAEHQFHAASVGKAFMGVAFARLVTSGQVNPDAPLSTWLPAEVTSRIPSSDQITARMLLQQTSGIVDVLNEIPDAINAIAQNPTHEWTDADLVQFALDMPLNFDPGTAFSYSNTNYVLLALILEAVTGQTHAQALRDLVFDPIGMTATATANHDALGNDIAHSYLFDGGVPDDLTELLLRWEFGSGGQWTTVDDMAKFLHTVAETDVVLDDAGRALLLTPSAHEPYGFGMATLDTPSGTMLWHHGLLFGSASYLSYFPDSGLSVTMNVNADARGADRVMLADRLFGELMGVISE